MQPIVLCVFGVNGVGKTTLLEAMAQAHAPSITVIRGSTILKEALGVASYDALERTPPAEKKQALLQGIQGVTEKPPSPITVVDMHLVVPIRQANGLTVEDMWDDCLAECIHGFLYITAPANTVAERRTLDPDRILRAQRATPQICVEDLQLSAMRWDALAEKMRKRRVIVNDQTIAIGAQKIWEFIQSF